MKLRALLFDLDGTMVQTREASWALFQRTNRKFKLGVDDREAFFALFQDNFFESLPRVCPDEATAHAAIEHFLGLLRREYEPPLVPGMADVIRTLSTRCVLAVVSTNVVSVVRRIAERENLSGCFAHIFAGDIEPDKRVSIRAFLRDPSYATPRHGVAWYEDTTPEPLSPNEVALVTDTVGDVRNARECGIRAIGVSWGMHDEKALLEAGAERVARWPQELTAWTAGDLIADRHLNGSTDIGTPTGEPNPTSFEGGPADGGASAKQDREKKTGSTRGKNTSKRGHPGANQEK